MQESRSLEGNYTDMLKEIKSGDLITILNIFREPIFKLSETDITKSVFNQWKFENILEKIINNNDNNSRSWNRFSITELALLYVVETLWARNIEIEKIKETIDLLIDGEDLAKQVNEILEDEENNYLNIIEKVQKIDLIGYIAIQKKQNPNLPIITTIEALMIGAIKLNRPHTLILRDNGGIEVFLTTMLTDLVTNKFGFINPYSDLFSKPFINISLQYIVEKILKNTNGGVATSVINTTPNNQIQKLINKGYSIEVLNDIFGKNQTKAYSEEVLDVKINIQSTIREYNDQYLLIKVGGKKISSIRRIIIKK